jgi:cation:H+ antiporter
MLEFVILVAGLLGLWLGTELVVRGAINVAAHMGLSESFIGMTILAIGTDLPEWVMSVIAGVHRLGGTETSGVLIGNAIGSGIGQFGVVLGITGLIGYVPLGKRQLQQGATWLFASLAVLTLVAIDGGISRTEGAVLLIVYIVYYVSLVRREAALDKVRRKTDPTLKISILYLAGGLIVVGASSHFVIESALSLAETLGFSQTFIGVIIIGFGTSVPELAISVGAMMRKSPGLSVGNLIGSNIFDTLVPIGTGAVIAGLKVSSETLTVDLPALAILTALVVLFLGLRKGLQRREALVLLIAYFLFAGYKIVSMA